MQTCSQLAPPKPGHVMCVETTDVLPCSSLIHPDLSDVLDLGGFRGRIPSAFTIPFVFQGRHMPVTCCGGQPIGAPIGTPYYYLRWWLRAARIDAALGS